MRKIIMASVGALFFISLVFGFFVLPQVQASGDDCSRFKTQSLKTICSEGGLGAVSDVTFRLSNLSLGSIGGDVSSLQDVLESLGFSIFNPTLSPSSYRYGYFGPATRRAIIAFQKKYGIVPASGFFGSLTKTKLVEILKGGGSPISVTPPSSQTSDVVVTTPALRDSWELGSTHTIVWAGAIPRVAALSNDCTDRIVSAVNTKTGTKYLLGIISPSHIDAKGYEWIVGRYKLSLCANEVSGDLALDRILPVGNYTIELSWFERVNGSLQRRYGKSAEFSVVIPSKQLKITSPAGGETWALGSTQKISWNTPQHVLSAHTVTISLLPPRPICLDAISPCKIAEIAPYVIAQNIANVGSYQWIIPSDFASPYIGKMRIRVEIDGVEDVVGVSNPFSIVRSIDDAKISVLTPDGGEQWSYGSQQIIRWSAPPSVKNVDIYLVSRPTPVGCTNSIPPHCFSDQAISVFPIVLKTSNTGSFDWLVGKVSPSNSDSDVLLRGDFVIRIAQSDLSRNFDESDASFTITKSVQKVSLNQKLFLQQGQTAMFSDFKNMEVTLKGIDAPTCVTCGPVAVVHVNVTSEGSQNLRLSVGDSSVVFGSIVTIDAIDVAHSSIILRVVEKAVSTKPLSLLNPNGGEVWRIGEMKTIAWVNNVPLSAMRIVLYPAGSSCVGARCENGVVLLDEGKNTGSFSWNVGRDAMGSAIPSGRYILRAIDSSGRIFDDSDDSFSLIDGLVDVPAATISIASPNGGEVFRVASSLNIRWSALNAPAYSWIALFSRSYGKATLIAQRVDPSVGGYDWIIPNGTALGDYTIEARLYTGPALCVSQYCISVASPVLLASDVSDRPFTITATNDSAAFLNEKFSLSAGQTALIKDRAGDVARLTFIRDLCSGVYACPRGGAVVRTENLRDSLATHDIVLTYGEPQAMNGFSISALSITDGIATFVVALSTSAVETSPFLAL